MRESRDAIAPLRDFVLAFGNLLDDAPGESRTLTEGGALLRRLVARDDWLPAAFAEADALRYRQYLLYVDAAWRFSVVSFVWGPGQATPVHDHTVWGLVGILRGAEYSQSHAWRQGRLEPAGPAVRLEPGAVESLSPTRGDVHRVRNAWDDRVSISIHVYGAVHRHTYPVEGPARVFVSGYCNTLLPDLWGCPADLQSST